MSFQSYWSMTEGTRATSFTMVRWCVENLSVIDERIESRYGYQMELADVEAAELAAESIDDTIVVAFVLS